LILANTQQLTAKSQRANSLDFEECEEWLRKARNDIVSAPKQWTV
jgi:Tfp pilus assembly PilM family ATPase